MISYFGGQFPAGAKTLSSAANQIAPCMHTHIINFEYAPKTIAHAHADIIQAGDLILRERQTVEGAFLLLVWLSLGCE